MYCMKSKEVAACSGHGGYCQICEQEKLVELIQCMTCKKCKEPQLPWPVRIQCKEPQLPWPVRILSNVAQIFLEDESPLSGLDFQAERAT
ncbi:hypothetical protein QE152_g12410 [Popillia japonica]|uniref:TNFR-Cys domain-containing protein n=1 Tax=Popillia japonica TaxID=7064 RepID=A0AAW1LSC8_POPJA